MLQFMGSQRVRHDWANELNWSEENQLAWLTDCTSHTHCPDKAGLICADNHLGWRDNTNEDLQTGGYKAILPPLSNHGLDLSFLFTEGWWPPVIRLGPSHPPVSEDLITSTSHDFSVFITAKSRTRLSDWTELNWSLPKARSYQPRVLNSNLCLYMSPPGLLSKYSQQAADNWHTCLSLLFVHSLHGVNQNPDNSILK